MVFESPTDQLLVRLQDNVAIVTLNRPKARNALSQELTAALRKAIAWAGQSCGGGSGCCYGAGSAFCSGGDVKAMGKRSGESALNSKSTRF